MQEDCGPCDFVGETARSSRKEDAEFSETWRNAWSVSADLRFHPPLLVCSVRTLHSSPGKEGTEALQAGPPQALW